MWKSFFGPSQPENLNQDFNYGASTGRLDNITDTATTQANTFMDPTSQWYQNMRRSIYEGVGSGVGVSSELMNRNLAARGMGGGGIANMINATNVHGIGEQVRQGNQALVGQGTGFANNLLSMAGQTAAQSGQMKDTAQQYARTSSYNQQLENKQSNASHQNNMWQSGLGLASLIFSDGRMKEDMSYLYTSDEGHNVYSFKYKGNDTVYSGVIAQEVLDVKPEAVSNINGKLAVDYSRIDVNMEVL